MLVNLLVGEWGYKDTDPDELEDFAYQILDSYSPDEERGYLYPENFPSVYDYLCEELQQQQQPTVEGEGPLDNPEQYMYDQDFDDGANAAHGAFRILSAPRAERAAVMMPCDGSLALDPLTLAWCLMWMPAACVTLPGPQSWRPPSTTRRHVSQVSLASSSGASRRVRGSTRKTDSVRPLSDRPLNPELPLQSRGKRPVLKGLTPPARQARQGCRSLRSDSV